MKIKFSMLALAGFMASCQSTGFNEDARLNEEDASALATEKREVKEGLNTKRLVKLSESIGRQNLGRAPKNLKPHMKGEMARAVHSQVHGCARGAFIVNKDIPKDYRTGIFQPGMSYPVWTRYSNGRPGFFEDGRASTRGVAIKLLDVENRLSTAGFDVPKWEIPKKPVLGQDFLFLNGRTFPVKTVKNYVPFTENLQKGELHSLKSYLRKDLGAVRQEFTSFVKMVTQKVEDPLKISYFSQTPYKWKDTAAKYRIDRCEGDDVSDKHIELTKEQKPRKLFHRMKDTLSKKGTVVCYDFSIILQKDAKVQPIEDSNIEWLSDDKDIKKNNKFANRQSVAKVYIPSQNVVDSYEDEFCEDLSFNPWNTLATNKPLGNMNRVRRAVYFANANRRATGFPTVEIDEEHQKILKQFESK